MIPDGKCRGKSKCGIVGVGKKTDKAERYRHENSKHNENARARRLAMDQKQKEVERNSLPTGGTRLTIPAAARPRISDQNDAVCCDKQNHPEAKSDTQTRI